MHAAPFKPTVYLREGCPFSFKFLLFLAEAGLRDRFELIRCNPDAPQFAAIRARLEAGLRKSATFPTVEVAPGSYMSDSDALIGHYASGNGIDAARLPALSFYIETIFPQLLRLHEGH